MSVPCTEGKVLVDIREFSADREGGVKAQRKKKVQLPSLDGDWAVAATPLQLSLALSAGRCLHAMLRDWELSKPHWRAQGFLSLGGSS